jgi:hypothetical protein
MDAVLTTGFGINPDSEQFDFYGYICIIEPKSTSQQPGRSGGPGRQKTQASTDRT